MNSNLLLFLENMSDEYPSSLELPLLRETCKSNTTHQEVPCLNLFPENIYETAVKLLYLSVKWVKTIPSFLQVVCLVLNISFCI